MPLAVRRVGGTEAGAATYTLGPGETFRLDSATFTIAWSNQGGYVTPVLQARNQGGDLIADIAAPSIVLFNPEFPSGFSYSVPAVLADTVMIDAPDGYGGYLLHDFGAGVTTSQITGAFDAPPATQGWATEVWLRSAGAASMGATIGSETVENTDTVTVTLTSPIAAGHHLLLHVIFLSPQNWLNPVTADQPVVTDSVGGNSLVPTPVPNVLLPVWGQSSLQRSDGLFLSSWVVFWRIVNPLPAGATVTLRNVRGPMEWLRIDVNDLTGLNGPGPIGPNAGGNYIQIGQTPGASPFTSTANPVPKWVGPVLINDSEIFPLGGTLDVSLARGETHPIPEPFTSGNPAPTYAQMGLPELRLVQGDTITATSMDETGPRTGDLIEHFFIYGVDV
jgi:hypothetical protein